MARRDTTEQGEPALLTALLHGHTIPDAAKASGLSERTIKRRLQDPAFLAALRDARQRALTPAINMLIEGTTGAAAQLRWLATNATQEHIQLAAARSILEYAFRGMETIDLAERVAALEQQREGRWGA